MRGYRFDNAGKRAALTVILVALLALPAALALAPRASAQEPGSISGTVIDADNSEPISGALVIAMLDPNDPNTWYMAYTDDYGDYLITGVPPSEGYIVSVVFEAEDVRFYIYNWEGSPVVYPYPVTVSEGQNTPDIDFALTPGGYITGTVTDGENPLADVRASVYLGENYKLDGYTDENGIYYAGPLEAGDQYTVQFTKDGYVTQWYNGKSEGEDYDEVSVTVRQGTTGIDAALSSGGAIKGRVTEAGTSTGLANCQVHIYTSGGSFVKSVTTNSYGYYTASGLDTGTYRVKFDISDNIHFDEWYQDKNSQEEANDVSVTYGQTTNNINGTLVKGGRISGIVSEEGSGNKLSNIQVKVYEYSSEIYTNVNALTGSDGKFLCGPLPTGNYKLYFEGDADHLSEWYNNKPSHSSATSISVFQGYETKNKNAALSAKGYISGTITGSETGNPALSGVEVRAYDTAQELKGTSYTNESGQYQISLWPGTYKVYYAGDSTHLAEWYNNQSSFAAANAVTVNSASGTAANAVLTKAFGSISGTVTGSEEGNPALQGVEVKLYSSGDVLLATTETAANGSYSFGNLGSGYYKLYFAGDTTHLPEYYNNRASLAEADTVQVTIPSGTTINVQLQQSFASISGVLYESLQPESRISNMEVRAYAAGTSTVVLTDYSEWNGNYALESLPAGDYQIYFAWNNRNVCGWLGTSGVVPTQSQADTISLDVGESITGKDVVLPYGGTIMGVVTDVNEDPVTACQITVYDAYGSFLGSVAPREEGQFSIGGFNTGDYKVYFNATDGLHVDEWYNNKGSYAEADEVAVVVGEPTTGINAVLDMEAAVSGTVTGSESGNPPLQGIEVKVYEASSETYTGVSAFTDSNGNYLAGPLDPGSYKLYFAGDSTHLAEWYDNASSHSTATQVTVTLGSVTTGKDAVLTRAYGSISGTVTGSEEGNPALQGIEVKLYDSGDNLHSTTNTNSSGAYSFTDLPAGSYKLYFGGDPTHMEEWYENKTSQAEATPVTVTLPNETVADAVLSHGYASISGKVRGSEDYLGIPGIEVALYTSTGTPVDTDDTDSEGNYTFINLPAGDYKVCFNGDSTHLAEWYNGKASLSEADIVSLSVSEEEVINVMLTYATGAVSGTVTGSEEGNPPLEGITVKAYDSQNNEKGSALTSPAGTYYIGDLPAGTYSMWFSGDSSHLQGWVNNVEVVLTQESAADAQLTQAFGSISGTVTGSEQGSPMLQGIDVNVYDQQDELVGSDTTDGNGFYEVADLVSGTYRVTFSGDSTHLPAETTGVVVTIPNATDCDKTLTQAFGSISGTVTGSEEGNPALGGITVTVYNSSDQQVGSDATDENGNYEVGNLPTGNYKVHFGGNSNHLAEYYNDKSSLASADLVQVTIPNSTDVDAVLTEAYGSISGTVTSVGSGNPVSNCNVRIYNAYNNALVDDTVFTDSSGEYSITGLYAGEYKIWFRANDNINASEWFNNVLTIDNASSIEVIVGEELELNVTLEPGGSISGRVTDDNTNDPVADCWVVPYIASTGSYSGTSYRTDNEGYYTIYSLPEGYYKVWFYPTDYHGKEFFDNKSNMADADPVQVTAGSTTQNVNATLTGTGIISGTVTEEGTGQPVSSCNVVCYRASDNAYIKTVLTGTDGSYSVSLSPGSYKLRFVPTTYHQSEFYDNRAYLADADPVQVIQGSTIQINAGLQRIE